MLLSFIAGVTRNRGAVRRGVQIWGTLCHALRGIRQPKKADWRTLDA